MDLQSKIKIAIAIEDQIYANAIRDMIEHHTFKAESGLIFDIKINNSAQECLNNIEKDTDILLLDYDLENPEAVPYSCKEILKIVSDFCTGVKIIVMNEGSDEQLTKDLEPLNVYAIIVKDENTMSKITTTIRKAVKESILDHNL